jgi:organic hydroperoxide reductase OsmC/OhrA
METRPFTYSASLEWTGGRRSIATADARPPIVITPPAELHPGSGEDWSPEHLFLASIQSCTMLSFVAHCAHNGLELVSYESRAEGTLERRESDRRYAFTAVDITVQVRMAGGHSSPARTLTAKAERDCFISASTTAQVNTDWRILE